MARLEDGTVGIKLLAGLPEGNGLPSIAEELLDEPRPVYALVEFRCKKETHDLDNDTHQVVLKIRQVEPLAGDEAKALREQLDTVRERRTGQRPLLDSDGTVPEGTETDDPPAVPATAPAAETVGDAANVPEFAPPTPIKSAAAKKAAGAKPDK